MPSTDRWPISPLRSWRRSDGSGWRWATAMIATMRPRRRGRRRAARRIAQRAGGRADDDHGADRRHDVRARGAVRRDPAGPRADPDRSRGRAGRHAGDRGGRDRADRGRVRQLDRSGHRGRRVAAGIPGLGEPGETAAPGPAVSTTDLIASGALVLGAFMSLLAGIAVLRFPDTMSRIHAATKPQVLGIILLMLGLGLRLGTPGVVGLLVLIVILQFVTAPVSAHLTVRVAYRNAKGDDGGPQQVAQALADQNEAGKPDRAAGDER